jgi:hypothetical protein
MDVLRLYKKMPRANRYYLSMHELRKLAVPYGANLPLKNGLLRLQNTYFL